MNTINLLSAISVLACNVSMAEIPKQARPNNYGDIITIDKSFSYNKANTLSGDFDLDYTNYGFNVDRYIGSYSDNAINFYSEIYYYTSYDSHYLDVSSIGCISFFTLAIYENTILSSFSYLPQITVENVSYNGSVNRVFSEYNTNLNITNLANTLYFSNYNLNWNDNDNMPLVCYANNGYLDLSITTTDTFDTNLGGALAQRSLSRSFDNVHGSINYSSSSHVTLNDTIENGNIVFYCGGNLTYKYYINNPTYEVIDLPNVMLSILTMPFTFFSQAFNLTLFPNTPYALNVGHTILIIVGVIGTIYLIKYLVGIFKG